MSAVAAQAPFQVPREFADVIRAHLPTLTEEMIGEIQASVPEYSRPGDEKYVKAVRRAVEEALKQFLNRVAGNASGNGSGNGLGNRSGNGRLLEVFRAIGKGEANEGRPLDSLQAALRICARVAWRRLAMESETLQLSRQRLCEVGEAILVYLDEIAAAAAEGYAEAQVKVAGELELRRRRLLDLLISDPPADRRAVEDLARAVRWPVPRTLAGVALAARSPRAGGSLLDPATAEAAAAVNAAAAGGRPALPPDVLSDLDRSDPCLIVPDPDGPGRAAMLDVALKDWVVVLGPAVPAHEAAQSLRLARDALTLARRGVLACDRVVRCADHLATLIIFKDEALIKVMRRVRLAPLRDLRPAQRDRIAETLLAWLQSGYNANEVAARLHIHPQTVRYRLRQATELFRDQLKSPNDRFELEIALRARTLAAQDAKR
ncbi:PucR family transcriptional regulator [Sphaerisporangium perillae]|uniref:PucR family transcriptional regulator n=1 Tax=Sphaerisporangium perillae TaxID=2935860 RepID=UPI00200BF796|nr:PucR family transcriptional regulator [Sphaerisporangium perillae]